MQWERESYPRYKDRRVEVEEEVRRERMREVVKNVKGRATECVKEQIYGGSRRWGRIVGVS